MSENNIREVFKFTRRQVLGLSVMGLVTLSLGGCAGKTPEDTAFKEEQKLLLEREKKYRTLKEMYDRSCPEGETCDDRMVPVLRMDDHDKPIRNPATGQYELEGMITPKTRAHRGGALAHRFILFLDRVPANRLDQAHPIIIDTEQGQIALSFETMGKAMEMREELDKQSSALRKEMATRPSPAIQFDQKFKDALDQAIKAADAVSQTTPFGTLSRDKISNFLQRKPVITPKPQTK